LLHPTTSQQKGVRVQKSLNTFFFYFFIQTWSSTPIAYQFLVQKKEKKTIDPTISLFQNKNTQLCFSEFLDESGHFAVPSGTGQVQLSDITLPHSVPTNSEINMV
jgi:hypothetical protein